MELIKIPLTSQPQIITTYVGSCQNSDSGAEEKEQEEGKVVNFQPRPTGREGAYSCPCSPSWKTPVLSMLCTLSKNESSGGWRWVMKGQD